MVRASRSSGRLTSLSGYALLASLALAAVPTLATSTRFEVPRDALESAVVASYARRAHAAYASCEQRAAELLRAAEELVHAPSPQRLELARSAWLRARDKYGTTEVLRFYGGPIDDPRRGLETLLNAWPLDEVYIDGGLDPTAPGIVQDAARYPNLEASLLELLNERGGEANISVGWHAVEFLLWGPDRDADGPGARSFEDYVAGRPHAARRGEYLLVCCRLLVAHHHELVRAWEPDAANYRAEFVARAPRESLRCMLAGMTILSGFELAGERLAVAYETRDQEQEHSCFSDNTLADFAADQIGILTAWRGGVAGADDRGLRELALRVDPELARQLDARLQQSLELLRAIPAPFDRAIRAFDGTPERAAVHAALVSLERQAELLAALGLALGHRIALRPGG